MEHTTIAVDLAKAVFQVAISHRAGRVDSERRLTRDRCLAYMAQQPPARVLLEACGSAHYWARQIQAYGHVVQLLPAHDVHRYVRRHKTDRTDTKALLEAARNEEIHSVPVKTVEQQALASLHRLRSTWVATRTSRLNTMRGLLREFGIFIPVGAHHVVPRVHEVLAEDRLPGALRTTLATACDEIEVLEAQMRAVEHELTALARQLADVPLLQTVPGVGLLTATALVARVGDIRRFRSGRHFASFLGLIPKEDSSAARRRLGAISRCTPRPYRLQHRTCPQALGAELRTSGERRALHPRLGAGKQLRASHVAQELSPYFRPRHRGTRPRQVFGPSTVELGRLLVGEPKCSFAFCVGEALPESHRTFSPIARRKLQELRKRAGFHVVILSREGSCRNRIDRRGECVTTLRHQDV